MRRLLAVAAAVALVAATGACRRSAPPGAAARGARVCDTDRDCKSPKEPHCDVKDDECVECMADEHCPAGRVCTADHCVPGCTFASQRCPDGERCDVDTRTCVRCDGPCPRR